MNRRSHHRALLALSRIPNIGNQRIKLLLQHFEDAEAVFKQGLHRLKRIDGIGDIVMREIAGFSRWDEIDDILEQTEQLGARLVGYNDTCYPPLLRQIYDAPPLFWLKGNSEILSKPAMAVIGTRNQDKYGSGQARKWTEQLVRSGLCVVSGLAYGVDSIAHKTVVELKGDTVAVLGSGINWIYPSKNRKLAERILENNGAIMTEFPPGTKPDAVNFPARNRIVSGMSLGVLVIQSGVKGGSMITARCALDQNREVFVVPHRVDDENGSGCNYLIKTGQGKLVQTLEDILVEIPHDSQLNKEQDPDPKTDWKAENLNDEQKVICEALENGIVHIDQLSEQMGKYTHELLPALLELEMSGIVVQKAGKYFELK